MKFEKSAGLIIFRIEQDKIFYLLLKYPTYWGFVKGIIEENEAEKETALREAKEETNLIDISVIDGFKEKVGWFYKLKGELVRKEAVFLIGETKNPEIKISHEHENFKWCPYDEALKFLKIKSNKILLEKAHNFLMAHLKQKRLV